MWFYRYFVRGLGLVLFAGLITILLLAIHSQLGKPGTDQRGHAQNNQRHIHTPSTEGRRPQ